MGRLRYSLLITVAAGLAATAVSAADTPPTNADTVVVWKRVSTASDPVSVAKEAAHALPAWAYSKTSEAVSSFVARVYKLDPHTHTAQIDAISQQVAALNGGAAAVPRNTGVIVPYVAGAIARLRSQAPLLSVDIRTADQVRQSIGPRLDALVRNIGKATQGFSIAIRRMSISQAEGAIEADPSLSIVSAPIIVKRASAGTPAAYAPSANDIAAIKAVAMLPQQQHPVMIVVDSVSPDQASELEARNFVLAQVAAIRVRDGLPPLKLFDVQCAANVPDTSWQTPPLDDGSLAHSIEIKVSLEPLVGAATGGVAPQLIYLPMLQGSHCQTEMLRQLFELHSLAVQLDGDFAKAADPEVADAYRQSAIDTIHKIGAAQKHGDFHTDVGVIDAILYFAMAYAEGSGNPVFTSMSWTYLPKKLDPSPPARTGGLYVVAAGNEGRWPTVEYSGFQFPMRSIKPADTLAVMNTGADGRLICDSSVMSRSNRAFATSFNGAIPGDCGTSFSAPRVAWLLALREAIRPAPATPAGLAAALQADALIGGPIRSEGGGRVLDVTSLFRDQLQTVVPAAPLQAVPPPPAGAGTEVTSPH